MEKTDPLLVAKDFADKNAVPLAKELVAWRSIEGGVLPEDSPKIRQLAAILNMGELNYATIDALVSIVAVEILAEAGAGE